jgi:hypothetical protein
MVTLEGKQDKYQITDAAISANYFQLLGIPIVRGRAFVPRENSSDQHLIIVSESTARKFWPGEDPLGKRVRVGDDKFYHELIGVSKDIRATGLGPSTVFIYLRRTAHPSRPVAARPRAPECPPSPSHSREQALDPPCWHSPDRSKTTSLFQPPRAFCPLAFTRSGRTALASSESTV